MKISSLTLRIALKVTVLAQSIAEIHPIFERRKQSRAADASVLASPPSSLDEPLDARRREDIEHLPGLEKREQEEAYRGLGDTDEKLILPDLPLARPPLTPKSLRTPTHSPTYFKIPDDPQGVRTPTRPCRTEALVFG
jgi:hypothetical protein